jgi:predicted Fe-Mo cluster-binding NifX family protein
MFALVDLQSGDISTLSKETSWSNPYISERCIPAELLSERGVWSVACRRMGQNTLNRLTEEGISVFATSRSTVGEVFEDYRKQQLEPMKRGDRYQGGPYYSIVD